MTFSSLRGRRVWIGASAVVASLVVCFALLSEPFADEGDTSTAGLLQQLRQTLTNLREKKQERYALRERAKQRSAMLEEETESLRAERDALLPRRDSLKNENGAIQKERDDLAKKVKDSDTELENVSLSVKETIGKLVEKIERGLPYRIEERKKVPTNFQENAGKDVASDVALLWQICMQEYELGFSSETYPGEVKLLDGRRKEGQYLRIGRVVLAYLTEDQLDCALSVNRNGRFEFLTELDSSRRAAIKESFLIARRQRSPAIVIFPIYTKITRGGSR
jgi:predicted nuclease with TOPRIM domain